MDGNFIVINRKIINWEWYQDTNVKTVFFHCLLMANWQDKKWRGQVIKRGQFITSREKLSKQVGLSVQQVRTALDKLKLTNELTIKTTTRNTIITVNNYSQYQDYNPQNNQHPTNNQPTSNQQITTTNKENKENNNNKISLSDDERKILKRFAKKQGAKNIRAYVHKLIVNGDYREIIDEEYKKIEQKKANEEYLRKKIEEERNAVDNVSDEERARISRINREILNNLKKGVKNDTRIYATQMFEPVRKSVAT